MSPIRVVFLTAACVALGAASAFAQTSPVRAPVRDDVRADDGRRVIPLKGGGILALDRHARVRMLDSASYNFDRIEILEGSVVVVTKTSGPAVTCGGDARLSADGIFRFDVRDSGPTGAVSCALHVADGAAAVPLVSLITALRGGQWMTLDPRCGDLIPVGRFSVDATDELDRWSRAQARE
jgi:ferric-dicitrate binding protein FerR (iron transport regulator)